MSGKANCQPLPIPLFSTGQVRQRRTELAEESNHDRRSSPINNMKPKTSSSFWRQVWLEFSKSRLNRFGLMIIALNFFFALFAPFLVGDIPLMVKVDNHRYFPVLQEILPKTLASHFSSLSLNQMADPSFMLGKKVSAIWPIIPYSHTQYNLDAILQPPSAQHWFGTDGQGRDVASRLVYGSRVSLSVGFVAVGIYTLIGIFLGACAGYFGGLTDLLISRLIEVTICFPTFFLILTVLAFIEPSIYNVMIVIGLTGWTGIARLVRGEILKQRRLDYVLAARTQGAGSLRIIFRHLLPNSLAPVFVSATFGVASAILIESSLSFLGFGVQPPTPSWGEALAQSREFIDIAWWLAFFPGLAVFFTITSFNLVGEGLRDAIDPRMRQR